MDSISNPHFVDVLHVCVINIPQKALDFWKKKTTQKGHWMKLVHQLVNQIQRKQIFFLTSERPPILVTVHFPLREAACRNSFFFFSP